MFTISATSEPKIFMTTDGKLVIPLIHYFQFNTNNLYVFNVGYYMIPEGKINLITESSIEWDNITEPNEGGMFLFQKESKIKNLEDSPIGVVNRNNWFYNNMQALKSAGGDFNGETAIFSSINNRSVIIDRDIPSCDTNSFRIYLAD